MSAAQAEKQPSLVVGPSFGLTISGPEGGSFSPSSFEYRVSASVGIINYSVRTPSWLTASPNSGSADTSGVIIRFAISPAAVQLRPGVYGPAIAFTNVTNGKGSTTRAATLTVTAQEPPTVKTQKPPPKLDYFLGGTTDHLLDKSGGRLLDDRGERLLAR